MYLYYLYGVQYIVILTSNLDYLHVDTEKMDFVRGVVIPPIRPIRCKWSKQFLFRSVLNML